MIAKDGEIFDSDNSTQIRLILLPNLSENGDLKEGLLDELLWTFSYFKCEQLFSLMIKYLDNLAKSSLTNRVHYFISISDVIAHFVLIELATLFESYSSLSILRLFSVNSRFSEIV